MKNVTVRIILVLVAIAVFSSCEKESVDLDWISGTYSTWVAGRFLIRSDTGHTYNGRLWVHDTSLNTRGDEFSTYVSVEGDHIFFDFEYDNLPLPTMEVEITSITNGTHHDHASFQLVNTDEFICIDQIPYHYTTQIIRTTGGRTHRSFRIYLREKKSDTDTLYLWEFHGNQYLP